MKRILLGISKLLVLTAVIAALFWAFTQGTADNVKIGIQKAVNTAKNVPQLKSLDEIPSFENPRQSKFQWEYKDTTYEIETTLYESVYSFYKNSPKYYSYYGTIPDNWEEEYYQMFVAGASNDQTMEKLAVSIETAAVANNLSEDEEVELAVAFVQSIPYDDQKARLIENGATDIQPRYPYEVLYENIGVCSGKTFLTAALLNQMGYGTALFEYKDQKHITAAVLCPQKYSSYDSGYCYIETTRTGHKIGIIPDLEASNNIAAPRKEIGSFEEAATNENNVKVLQEVGIFQKTQGKIYQGIIQTIKTENRITDLEKQIYGYQPKLNILKAKVAEYEEEVEELGDKLDDKKKEGDKDGDYESYNKLVPEYNKLLEKYKKKIKEYNQEVKNYNQIVAEYNRLIKNN